MNKWLFVAKLAIFQLYHGENRLHFVDGDIYFVLDQNTPQLDFYNAIYNSLKQDFSGRHIAPLGHIILILSQPVFALTPECCIHSG